jgi:hypothetical protein
VADVDNLCLMMNLLKDPSRSIQFEAFHVFKVTHQPCCRLFWLLSIVTCCFALLLFWLLSAPLANY